jgi:hypothetical protein
MKIIFEEGFEAEAVYYPVEEVWHSDDFSGYEWDSEREMRRHMLIHFLCEENEYLKPSWFMECYDENDVREVINNIMSEDYEDYRD